MSINRNHEGAWIVSTIHGGYLITRKYYGHTKKQALALFKNELKGI